MNVYTLPDLPYDYDALEPFLSKQLLELHHKKHHAAYVAGANTALASLEKARSIGDVSRVSKCTRDLAFNLAGHVNHSVFWTNLCADGGGEPTTVLADGIANDFGSFEAFKRQFCALATSVQGSGWVMLAFDPVSSRLVTLQLHDHQDCMTAGVVPLLMLDMWEHAYYLDYHNAKADYVAAFWDVINWDDVARRFDKALAPAS
ncbi:MAG: superoxide dismutase [Atopobiaceae bacterium]|nr:superoxide dismutase [Atopobiaceae bacterium]